jgi:hypothetical protein
MGREARARAGDGRVLKCGRDLPARNSSAECRRKTWSRLAPSTAIESYLNHSLAVLTGSWASPRAAMVLP